jgi:hypothetical protein
MSPLFGAFCVWRKSGIDDCFQSLSTSAGARKKIGRDLLPFRQYLFSLECGFAQVE